MLTNVIHGALVKKILQDIMANLFPSFGSKRKVRCKHLNLIKRVIEALVTCETTAAFCADCGKQITQPKTDCA